MLIKSVLSSICNYYNTNRQIGYSSLAINGINSNQNAKFIVAFNHHKKLFGIDENQCVSVGEFPLIMTGRNVPFAFDNYALHLIFEDSLNTINELEKENLILKNKLDKIKEIIK
jgi:hypothetical protein